MSQENVEVVRRVFEVFNQGGVVAALAYRGATDAAAFETFVERHLCPALRAGDVVILDRLSAHLGRPVREAVDGAS